MKTILAVVAVIVDLFFIVVPLRGASFTDIAVFFFVAAFVFALLIVKAVHDAL